jgi:hypothetical protein
MSFDAPPQNNANGPQHRRQIAQALIRTMQGKLNNTGTVTLDAVAVPNEDEPTVEQVVDDPLCGPESAILFMPTTQSAAAELASGNMYVSAQTGGQFTITCTSSTDAVRTYRYAIFG